MGKHLRNDLHKTCGIELSSTQRAVESDVLFDWERGGVRAFRSEYVLGD
jgi:hypothetical protein